jgi:poly-gamma-glutamate capsule biosynthesis protein CapA/YwtB (metallophosphatase superfamily)
MRKRNLVILAIVCILSLCFLTGLLVYAFDLQAKEDLKDRNNGQNTENSEDLEDPDTAKVTASPAPSEPARDNPAPDQSVSTTPTPTPEPSKPIVLAFAGDVNFDEDSYPSKKYDAENQDILGCFSEDLLEEMNSADVMMLNNEFAYSTRGTEETNKSYTFRANPGRVEILKKMGVDIVSLANNHALDFGPDALQDTFDTLEDANIDYVGAGENLDRAKAPVYYTVGDKKIAFVAASHVVFDMSWYASDTKLGMVGTYDPTLILESIKEAEANSDFVVIFVHWGVERENYPVDYQRNLAKLYIDAGADAVIGCHPHVMQGFEYYKGKPIAYSLGNYWFNNSARETGLFKLYIDPDDTVRAQILPAMGKDTFTYLLTEEDEKKDYVDFMQKLSYNVTIDQDGFLTETAE